MKTSIQLIEEVSAVFARLAEPVPGDFKSLLDSLEESEVLLARANQMVAEAKARKDEAIRFNIDKESDQLKGMSASLATKYLAGLLSNETYAVELAEGLSAALVHRIDSQRSRLSSLKEELRQLSNPRTVSVGMFSNSGYDNETAS